VGLSAMGGQTSAAVTDRFPGRVVMSDMSAVWTRYGEHVCDDKSGRGSSR
jgi:hypothetical protein